jgi:hypothetical protein
VTPCRLDVRRNMLPPSLLRFVKRLKYFPLFSTLDLIKPTCIRYRVIQSFNTTLNEVVREMMCGRKCNFFLRFATVSELRRFYIDVAFTVVIVDFCKMETVRFNITCHIFPWSLESSGMYCRVVK